MHKEFKLGVNQIILYPVKCPDLLGNEWLYLKLFRQISLK